MKVFAAVLVLLVLLLIAGPASAQVAPTSCRPAKLADVHLVKAGDDFAGWWWCDATKDAYAWRGILRPAITADLTALAYAWAVTGDTRIFEQVVTLQGTDPQFAGLRAAVVADVKAKTPQYIVAKNGTYTDRPAYLVVDGKRLTTSTARALVGWACDCKAISLVEGTTRYCRIGEPLVAVCVTTP